MVERVIWESIACKEPFVLEYRITDAQGNIRWLYEKGQGAFTESDQLLWLDGAIFDISDRKQVEAELLERVHISILMAEIGSASTQLLTLEEVLQAFAQLCCEAWEDARPEPPKCVMDETNLLMEEFSEDGVLQDLIIETGKATD